MGMAYVSDFPGDDDSLFPDDEVVRRRNNLKPLMVCIVDQVFVSWFSSGFKPTVLLKT